MMMMDDVFYFWKDKQVVIVTDAELDENFASNQGLICVDTQREEPEWRYGWFSPEDFSRWSYIPLDDFPKEFRVHLLLLGVS